ncbi:MAG: hypothetical protein J6K20_00160 [Thermoguttaceae bacterium]|nr:hypothetical protein [Thermoguttaceae bacterium]
MMKKEFVITKFEDVMFRDFENYVGKKDVVFALKKAFEDAMNAARRTINKMLDSNSRYRNYNDSQLDRLHEHSIRLAEVDFKWRSCENNIGRLILIGFAVSAVVNDVRELKETIEKEVEDKENKSWDILEEEYDD